MDELNISGKRYLSSRRVAKENGYHTDYIGQLIRGGKVKGQKVGRTWYVEAASFESYLGKESTEMPEPQPIAAEPVSVPQPVVEEQMVEAKPIEAPATPVASTPVAVIEETPAATPEPVATPAVVHAMVEEAPTVIPQAEPVAAVVRESADTFAVPMRKIDNTPVALRSTPVGLRYVPQQEALIPEIPRSERVTRVMPSVEVSQVDESAGASDVYNAPQKKVWVVGGLVAAGIAVFVFSATMSSGLLQTINIDAGKPASVSYSLQW